MIFLWFPFIILSLQESSAQHIHHIQKRHKNHLRSWYFMCQNYNPNWKIEVLANKCLFLRPGQPAHYGNSSRHCESTNDTEETQERSKSGWLDTALQMGRMCAVPLDINKIGWKYKWSFSLGVRQRSWLLIWFPFSMWSCHSVYSCKEKRLGGICCCCLYSHLQDNHINFSS